MPSKKQATTHDVFPSGAKPVSIANDVATECQLDAENSTSSALHGATNNAHPSPLSEGQLLQMIVEMKAQMKERQVQTNLERKQAALDRENARRDHEQTALDRENTF